MLGTNQRTGRGQSLRILVAALTVLLLALLVWIYRGFGAQESAGRSSAPRSSQSALPAVAAESPTAPTQEPARTAIVSTDSAAAAALADADEVRSSPDELRGRVVDPELRPIAGASISLRRGEARDFTVLDLEINAASEEIATAITGADGEFRFEIARGIPVDLQTDAPGFCSLLLPDRHAGEYVVVQLSAGFTVFGRVTRAVDGAPVVEAKVRVFKRGGPASLARSTLTAGNGSFELRFGFSEGALLEIVPQLEQCPGWMELQLGGESRLEKNVSLPSGCARCSQARAV